MSSGGGYWVWKPKIILDKLEKIDDNDVLVYIDSGCTINKTAESSNRFLEYINMVSSHWTGFLRFELTHKEADYTNRYCIEYLSKYFDTDFSHYTDSFQILGGILIMRKTDFTLDFFRKHVEIVTKNPRIHTDIYTENGEKHRHDQSIMSLLYKHMG